jgi:hypothetical protein
MTLSAGYGHSPFAVWEDLQRPGSQTLAIYYHYGPLLSFCCCILCVAALKEPLICRVGFLLSTGMEGGISISKSSCTRVKREHYGVWCGSGVGRGEGTRSGGCKTARNNETLQEEED